MNIVDYVITWHRNKVSGYVDYDKRPRRKFNRKTKLRLMVPATGMQDCFYSMTIVGRFTQEGKRINFNGRSLA